MACPMSSVPLVPRVPCAGLSHLRDWLKAPPELREGFSPSSSSRSGPSRGRSARSGAQVFTALGSLVAARRAQRRSGSCSWRTARMLGGLCATADDSTRAELEACIASVSRGLQQLDKLVSNPEPPFPESSSADGLAAVSELEDLLDAVDIDAASFLEVCLGEQVVSKTSGAESLKASSLNSKMDEDGKFRSKGFSEALKASLLNNEMDEDGEFRSKVVAEALTLTAPEDADLGIALAETLREDEEAVFDEDDALWRASSHDEAAEEALVISPEEAELSPDQLQAVLQGLEKAQGPAEKEKLQRRGSAKAVPIVSVLDEMPHAARAGLGPNEAAATKATRWLVHGTGHQSLKKSVTLKSLSRSFDLKYDLETVAERELTRIMDVPELCRPGDAFLLDLSSDGLAEENSWVDAIHEAVRRGAEAALIYVEKALDSKQMAYLRSQCPEAVLVTCEPLEDATGSGAARLAKAFWALLGFEGSHPKSIAVVGGEESQVRTTAWLMSSLLEETEGSDKSGLLSGRRTLLGYSAIDVGHPLTPCIVEEMLAGMAKIEVCVFEAAPDAKENAFDGLNFDYVIDLGEGDNGNVQESGNSLRKRILQRTEKERVVAMVQGSDKIVDKGRLGAAFAMQLPPHFQQKETQTSLARSLSRLGLVAGKEEPQRQAERAFGVSAKRTFADKPEDILRKIVDLQKLKKQEIITLMKNRGLEVNEALKKDILIETLLEDAQEDKTKTQEVADTSAASAMEGVLCGQVLHGSSVATGLQLQVQPPGVKERQTLLLPLIGSAGAKAVLATIAAASYMSKKDTQSTSLPWLTGALQAAAPAPGVLEVVAVPSKRARVVGVLHDASSPRELHRALQQIREWSCGSELTVVFGCQGEVSRGDRAKYGWALAEFSDRVVLTSQQPRSEPPMQVVEDILDSLSSRVTPSLSSGSAGSRIPGLLPLTDVHVVADRADAIKLGACWAARKRREEQGVVVLIGSSHRDVQEAAGHDGLLRHWLFNDRKMLLESLELANKLLDMSAPYTEVFDEGDEKGLGFDITKGTWNDTLKEEKAAAKDLVMPGRSLHWTFEVLVGVDGVSQHRL